jgi:hypothetical protein
MAELVAKLSERLEPKGAREKATEGKPKDDQRTWLPPIGTG